MNTDPETLDSVPDPQIVYFGTFYSPYLVPDLQIVYLGTVYSQLGKALAELCLYC